jgi:flagellar basal-body rod modification protein FlgD
MDSANFASQLAAFSSVEQQVLTNNHLETIKTHLGSSELLQFTEWIGKFAKVTGPAHFSGTSIDIAISIPESTERADFIVKNEPGSVVFRKPISNDTTEFSWGADYLWRNCTKCSLRVLC